MRLALVLVGFLFYFVGLLMQNHGCHGCIEKERMGLLDIKAYILAHDGDPDSELASWIDDRRRNCCAWNRLKCSNISTGHVTQLSLDSILDFWGTNKMLNVSLFRPFEELLSLDLSDNGIEGWIGNEGFPRLKKLEILDLSLNMANSCNIFRSLNKLASLRTLKLSTNLIRGSFSPQDFINFSRLELLDLSNNFLNGSLDVEGIQKLRRLKVMDLSSNKLIGSIEGLCKMKDLIQLGLSKNKFSGQIPNCLSNLRNLQILDLSQNQFNGNFPSFITNLTSLVYLSILGNHCQGLFSMSTLANHSKLQVLYISSQSPGVQVETEKLQWFPTFQLKSLILRSCNLNMDKGSTIPNFLQYQKELQFIDLSHNKLVGAFPSWLIQNNSRLETILLMNNSFDGSFQLSSIRQNMHHLDISSNNITGPLPKDIGTFLPGVEVLDLSMNNFDGNIPATIGKMQQLVVLDLSHNHFSGELHEQLTSCIRLQYLKLSNNFLQGNIPNFCNLNLSQLYLNNNYLNGTLKEVLENLKDEALDILDLSNNSIVGEIPSSIENFSSILILLMAENQLEGEIPFEFSSLTMLIMLDLSKNKLSGSLSHLTLSSMKFLYLQKNAFVGSIPYILFEGPELITLDLRDNNFSGTIPNRMNKMPKLRVLLLGGNNFHGHIPIQFCQLIRVTIMDLSRNKINGSIPPCFNNFSFGMVENHYDGGPILQLRTMSSSSSGAYDFLDANVSLFMPTIKIMEGLENFILTVVEFRTKSNYYSYSGNILENMTGMDLSCNMLTGIIPSQIGNLQQIRAMNLSHNYLLGFIPNTFSNLALIESLDLSYNNLTGEIPSQLTHLNFLSIFNVSYNNLSGTPPSTGQFQDFDEDNYKGNPGLCGPLLKRKCVGAAPPSSQSNTIKEDETTLDMVAFYWSFCASYITFLLGIIMVLCINARWRMTWFYYISKLIYKCFPSFPLY